MGDLVQWLTAQLDEDERITRAATSGPWHRSVSVAGGVGVASDDDRWVARTGDENAGSSASDADYIAAHDPARALREIDAKRQMLSEYAATDKSTDAVPQPDPYDMGRLDALEKAVQLAALPYADRPGYREEWRP